MVYDHQEHPWAIEPDHLLAALAGSAYRAGTQPGQHHGGLSTIAVLPLYGILVHRARTPSDLAFGTPLDAWAAAFTAAVDDPNIDGILIDIDSPGGRTAGVTETATVVRRARRSKPIVAIANTLAASAAYWIGAQADEIVASPSAEVGSIGVLPFTPTSAPGSAKPESRRRSSAQASSRPKATRSSR
jgi:ClpP class serine protease